MRERAWTLTRNTRLCPSAPSPSPPLPSLSPLRVHHHPGTESATGSSVVAVKQARVTQAKTSAWTPRLVTCAIATVPPEATTRVKLVRHLLWLRKKRTNRIRNGSQLKRSCSVISSMSIVSLQSSIASLAVTSTGGMRGTLKTKGELVEAARHDRCREFKTPINHLLFLLLFPTIRVLYFKDLV